MPRTILVRGFDPGTTRRELLDLFASHAHVLSLRLVGTRGRLPEPRCFVRMRDPAAAERAVEAVDGREYNGRVLWVDIIGLRPADAVGDLPASRNVFETTSADTRGADTPAGGDGPSISFVVGARAFRHLIEHLAALPPRARVAVGEARDRGRIAAVYYFIDVADDVVRDVRDSLRVRSRRKDHDGRACEAAASAIEGRRRSVWALRACPRCGGHVRPASWLTPAVFVRQCDSCRWTVPR